MLDVENENYLLFGDNSDWLEEVPAESIDLVYLDPPFKTQQNYNVLFRERDGTDSTAQIQAFEDTWHWDREAVRTYQNVVESGEEAVANALEGLKKALGTTDMLAYLTYMAPRLESLKNKLKDAGSIFLHCDPAASHYLKVIMDAVFGAENFRNEIIWRNHGAHAAPRRFDPIHQNILFYSKTDNYFFNTLHTPYKKGHVETRYTKDDQGRYKETKGGNILTGPGATEGESGEEWRGVDPTDKGRHWAVPSDLKEQIPDEEIEGLSITEQLEKLYQEGLIEIKDNAYWPHPVRYLDLDDPEEGYRMRDIWAYEPYTEGVLAGTDKGIDEEVKWLGPTSDERLGYPTQKPVGLLQRILKSCSPEGGRILDPFCGCGTTIDAAEELDRKWIGIDITYQAIALIRRRLNQLHPEAEYVVKGQPTTENEARNLAEHSRYQFELWALDEVGARPHGGASGDSGYDGKILFHDDNTPETKTAIFEVKSGENVGPKVIRNLRGVLDQEDAQIGVLITLASPTREMRAKAAEAGTYDSPFGSHDKIQIMEISDILDGETPDIPNSRDLTHETTSRTSEPEQEDIV